MGMSFLKLIVFILAVSILASCAGMPPSTSSLPADQVASLPQISGTAASPFPLPPESPTTTNEIPSGSLWTGENSSLWQDIKAHQIGDIVTITVSEKSDASKQASTKVGRTKDTTGDAKFLGLKVGDKTIADKASIGYGGKFESKFDGSGMTSKTDSMTAYMSASVVDVLPNGNLVIRGSRWTKVNDELQQIILEGIVRPNDINRRNEILSQHIAEAKIFIVGKGPVSSHQKPGWLGQFFDFLNPF